MASDKSIVFSAAIRGFHVYKTSWKPVENEKLQCFYEDNNPYDICSIKVCQLGKDAIVGHLPMEISRITKFALQRGAQVHATLTSKHYRRSPLVQGGLEIPCKVDVRMSGTIVNHAILQRYEKLVEELYAEPANEEILGSFLHPVVAREAPEVFTAIATRRKSPKPPKQTQVKYADIRTLFKENKQTTNEKRIVVIDIE